MVRTVAVQFWTSLKWEGGVGEFTSLEVEEDLLVGFFSSFFFLLVLGVVDARRYPGRSPNLLYFV